MPAKNELITIAICYDFDGTLIPGNMQEYSLFPALGIDDTQKFWHDVKELAKEKEMDEILAYMEHMIRISRERKKPFNKQTITDHGRKLKFFPGVTEWFDAVDSCAAELGLSIDHYVISSGLDDMIRGSSIGDKFKLIFASGFAYDANMVPEFAARSVNYTTKTQYLFRINKGVLNNWDNATVNTYMPYDERPVPFERMIYIGDGDTDIPAMKMINYQGGYSIIVYPPSDKGQSGEEKKKGAENIYHKNRAQFLAEADYRRGRRLYQIITALLQRIADEEKYEMNRNTNYRR